MDYRAGRTAAILDSVVGSCKRLGGDPFADLNDVLNRLPTHPVERLGELLPKLWLAAYPDTRRKATI
ncbi:transposase domain-containing protein [Tautonia rosea]|uniref:transposase domain-containing protein n=1 Tax=Tautonia rosea TaxID=2728037 RepID=UPI001475CE40